MIETYGKKKKTKDLISDIAVVLTMIFKLGILATVLNYYLNLGWLSFSLMLIPGIVWTMGIGNVVYFYMLFTNKFKK